MKTTKKKLVNILASVLCMFICILMANAEETKLFASGGKWRHINELSTKTIEKAMGENSGLQIDSKLTAKKKGYMAISHWFKKYPDWSGVKKLSFFAKADKRIALMFYIRCKGGSLLFPYTKHKTGKTMVKYTFEISKAKKQKNPDLSQIQSISIGMGIWSFDSTKETFSMTLAKFETLDTANAYVIPVPGEEVVVDTEYKSDWGFEDTLYNWTPPDYIYLNSSTKVVPGSGKWRNMQQLSGRFSFMIDDENLYFLGLVTDISPRQGVNQSLWKNDSIELFVAPGVNNWELRNGKALSKAAGLQIIFSCSKKLCKALVLSHGKKKSSPDLKFKVKETSWLTGGKQSKGYILEAAIPLKLFPGLSRQRGKMLAYTIKLNDNSGLSLSTTPENQRPNDNIKNFKKAYVEIISKDQNSKIKFPPSAKNLFWPHKYTGKENPVRIWDMTKAWRDNPSSTTSRLYLNTLWAVQGTSGDKNAPDPANWYYMPLPLGIGFDTPVFLQDSKTLDTLSSREYGYRKITGGKKVFFWYERLFTVDNSMKDKTTYLNIDYVINEASVYLNKELIGTITPGNPRIDVTGKLKFGTENRLDLLLYSNIIPAPSVRNGRSGITGNIYLEAFNHKPVIEDLWVKSASGIDGSFDIQVESKASKSSLKLKLEILDKTGQTVLSKEKNVPASSRKTITNITGSCADFRAWSPEYPELFCLKLQVYRDGRIIEEKKKQFGFRTFTIRDGHFYLNGKIFRMRVGYPENLSRLMQPDRMAMLKRFGFNAIYLHAVSAGYNDPLFDKLDKDGFVVFAPVAKSWSKKTTAAKIRKYRSHPSVIGYVSDPFGQLDLNGFIHNPFCVSDNYYPESDAAIKLYDSLRKRNKLFKSIDPTRPYIPQGTGNFEGAFKNIHHYPCYGLNLLDRIMYFEPWSKRKNPIHPLYIIECGINPLLWADSTHPEHKYPVGKGQMAKRLLTYEQASRYLGPKAFDGWEKWNQLFATNIIRGFRTCGVDAFNIWDFNDLFLKTINTTKAKGIKDRRKLSYKYFLQPFSAETIDKSWMRSNSWFYRLRALACRQWPKEFGQVKLKEKASLFTRMFENEWQPLLIYIGGRKGEVFSRAHNYTSGENIDKQIVIVNDSTENFAGKVQLCLELGDRKIRKTVNVEAVQGQIIKTAFSFSAPVVKKKTYGKIKLEYTNPKGKLKNDEFEIAVFPAEQLKLDWNLKTAAITADKNSSILKKIGINYEKISSAKEIPNDIKLLVIDKNALTGKINSSYLKKYINKGGQVLILEQNDKSLLDWRLKERRLESLYIANRKHPVVKGLRDNDLKYFRGAATSIPKEKHPSKAYRHTQAASMDIPHLTNVGIVAAYVMQKPCYGSFTPILVGGYDLEETALIEMRSNKGRAIFCQVDISGRYGLDPAATRLTKNIFNYLAGNKARKELPSVDYLGGERGKGFLSRIGITAKNPKNGKILVIGDNAAKANAITAEYETVIVLPFSNYLPANVKTKSIKIQALDHPHFWGTNFYQFEVLKSMLPAPDRLGQNVPAEFLGLVDNDLYFFESPSLKSYIPGNNTKVKWHSKRSTMALLQKGKTSYLLCSINPYKLKHGECRRKAWRLWSIVFSNLKLRCKFELAWKTPPFDISRGKWTFLTDPDGNGEEKGFQNGNFGGRTPRKIVTGKIWEEAGVNDINPNIKSAPDSAYDGFGWYFRKVKFPADTKIQKLYFEIAGVRDIPTFSRILQKTTLWINGKKMPPPTGIYNAFRGGRAGRLWTLPKDAVKAGETNFIAIQIFNRQGAGGIDRKPIRFETDGQNAGMLFPYEFVKSKYNPYFFWCW